MARTGTIFFFVIVFSLWNVVSADGWRFARPLSAGAHGPDVFALQKLLNENAETRVAETGAGSPGKETSYFGPATARAVTVFQKHNGIEGEVGRVGPVTLGVLNEKIAQHIPRPSGTPFKGGTAPSPLEGSTPTIVGGRDVLEKAGGDAQTTNPNARNLDQFLDTIRKVGAEQGYTPEKLDALTTEVSTAALATTTDFFAQFAHEVSEKNNKVSLESPLWEKTAAFLKKIADVFALHADAQAPSFGGLVTYVFFCTCSGNWLMGMVPLSIPPIILMTHYTGSQIFANFNTPFTLFLLGNYIPQGAPCLFYVGLSCVQIPSQAQTSPILGSS